MTDIPILGRKVRLCRGCGCDDDHACITEHGPCAWVLLDIDTPTGICSACAVEMGFDPQILGAALCPAVAEALARAGFLGPEALQAFEEEDANERQIGHG